jgi:hypothetical protein
VIRSKAAFTYAEAQNRIDDLYVPFHTQAPFSSSSASVVQRSHAASSIRRQTDPLSKNVRILNSLAKILKKKRMEVLGPAPSMSAAALTPTRQLGRCPYSGLARGPFHEERGDAGPDRHGVV